MRKRIIALLLALILTVGLLPTVALAADGDPTTDGGSTTMTDTKTSGVDSEGNTDNPVHIVKSVTTDEHGNGTLKLEAYVTDPMTIKTSDVPLDIVLVLDQSGSMGFCVNCGAEFSNGSWQKRKCEYTQYVEVGLAKNLTSSSSSEQLYAFDSWDNSYDPVEYCDGTQHSIFTHSAGWYWKNYLHIRDNRIDSESKLYKKVTTKSDNHVHRLDTLTGVLGNFTKSVGDKATGTPNVKHRIAMVGFSSRQWNNGGIFSSGSWEDYKNTEILTGVNSLTNSNDQDKNGNDYYYFPNGYTATNGVQKDKAGDTDYKNALVDVSQSAGQASVAKAIKALTACGGTFTDDGLEMAQEIFKANPLTGENAGRKRIVILFTDGKVDDNHRTKAESTATALKNSGVTVYTIGLFEKANQTTNEGDNDFLQKVSSNNGVAPKQGEKSYYLSATNAASLQKVFEQITEEVNKLMLNVGASTVLSDTLSEHFDFAIPANGNLSDKVTFKLVPVDNKDADGNFTWKEADARTLTGGEKPTLNHAADASKSFTVTNFDYGANKITRVYDQTTGQITGYTGSKLVIEIPIKADTSCTRWDATKDTYPTNSSTNGAKLEYKDEKNNLRSTGVESPKAPVARYSVTYDYGTGSEQPTGVMMPTDTKAYIDGQTIEVEPASTAPDGYTFDGWYTDADCTPTNKVDAENPPAIDKANCTLYGKFTKSAFDVNLSTYFKKYLTLTGVTELPNAENFTITGAEYVMNGEKKELTGVSFTGETGAIKSTPVEGTAFTGDGMTIRLSVGTHYFTVTETAGTTTGMTYAQPKDITITVTANTAGTGADVTVSDGTITNTYAPGRASLNLTNKFEKELISNTNALTNGMDSFSLVIKEKEGEKTIATGHVTSVSLSDTDGDGRYDGKQYFNFDSTSTLYFDRVGIFTYTVQEAEGDVKGMSYDTTLRDLVITVVNGNGTLKVASAVIDSVDIAATQGKNTYTITNTFTAATLPLDPDPTTGTTAKVIKVLSDDSTATTEDMTFRASMTGDPGVARRVARATVKAGEKTADFSGFGTLVFTEETVYKYEIYEEATTSDRIPGVRYDQTRYTLKVDVRENTNHELYINSAQYTAGQVEGNILTTPITFTNKYTEPENATVVSKTVVTDLSTLSTSMQNGIHEFESRKGITILYPVANNGKNTLEVTKGTTTAWLLYKISVDAGTQQSLQFDDANVDSYWYDGDKVAVSRASSGFKVDFKNNVRTADIYVTVNHPLNFDKGKCTVENVISEEIKATTTVTEKDPDKLYLDFSKFVQKELTATGTKTASDVNFTVDVKEFKTVISSIQGEEEVNTYAGEQLLSTTLTAHFDSITGGETKTAPFNGSIVVEHAGTYSFELTEEDGQRTGVTYDDSTYKVYVYVKREGDKLVVGSFNIYKDGGSVAGETITFHNTIDTGKDDYYPIIIPTIINKDTGMLNKTDHFAYVIGYPDGTVHPNGQITRAEVATIFFRLLRDEVRDGAFTTSNSYSDVAYGKWYNNPISTMSALGIITGYPDGTFKPNKPITRAEFAAIAARFDETQSGKSATFSDVIGHWAAKEIGIAYYNDWIKGYPDGTFKPDQNITRAEAMTLINRVLERKPESPADLLTNMNKWTDNLDTSKWYYLDVQEATNSHGYTRKTFNYELWRQMLNDPDWSRYER